MNSNFDVNFGKKELNMSLNIGSEELKTEIVFPAGGGNVDLTEVAKETTLNSAKEEILTAVDNAKPEIDTTELAKQGENIHATNTAIYESLKSSSGYIKMTNSEYNEFKAHIIEVTNDILN